MLTAQEIKNAIAWEQRVFFVSDYSEVEELRWVINYAKTAANINALVAKNQQKTDEFLKKMLDKCHEHPLTFRVNSHKLHEEIKELV